MDAALHAIVPYFISVPCATYRTAQFTTEPSDERGQFGFAKVPPSPILTDPVQYLRLYLSFRLPPLDSDVMCLISDSSHKRELVASTVHCFPPLANLSARCISIFDCLFSCE